MLVCQYICLLSCLSVTLNKSIINYPLRYTYHLLYLECAATNHWSKYTKPVLDFLRYLVNLNFVSPWKVNAFSSGQISFSTFFNIFQVKHFKVIVAFSDLSDFLTSGIFLMLILVLRGRRGLVGLFVKYKSHGAKGRGFETQSVLFFSGNDSCQFGTSGTSGIDAPDSRCTCTLKRRHAGKRKTGRLSNQEWMREKSAFDSFQRRCVNVTM